MIKHFNSDGSVRQAWPGAVSASPVVRDGKTLTQVQGSNFVLAEVELGEGEQIGTDFAIPLPASTLEHPAADDRTAIVDIPIPQEVLDALPGPGTIIKAITEGIAAATAPQTFSEKAAEPLDPAVEKAAGQAASAEAEALQQAADRLEEMAHNLQAATAANQPAVQVGPEPIAEAPASTPAAAAEYTEPGAPGAEPQPAH